MWRKLSIAELKNRTDVVVLTDVQRLYVVSAVVLMIAEPFFHRNGKFISIN